MPGNPKRTWISAKLTTLPVLVNHVTTGHKLQGQSKDSIFVHAWPYTKNWPYVVLSRVHSLAGLFLRTKLDPSKNFSNDSRITHMLNNFHRNKAPRDPEDYFH